MYQFQPKTSEIRHLDGVSITLDNYERYCTIGLDYSNLDQRGRGTPTAQEVFLWCEDQGWTWALSERYHNFAYLTVTEAAAFKIRWF